MILMSRMSLKRRSILNSSDIQSAQWAIIDFSMWKSKQNTPVKWRCCGVWNFVNVSDNTCWHKRLYSPQTCCNIYIPRYLWYQLSIFFPGGPTAPLYYTLVLNILIPATGSNFLTARLPTIKHSKNMSLITMLCLQVVYTNSVTVKVFKQQLDI